jgi:hypothetical protein
MNQISLTQDIAMMMDPPTQTDTQTDTQTTNPDTSTTQERQEIDRWALMRLELDEDETLIDPDKIPKFLIRKGYRYVLKKKNDEKKNYVYKCEDSKRLNCRGKYKICIKKNKIKEKLSKNHNLYHNYHTYAMKNNKKKMKGGVYQPTKGEKLVARHLRPKKDPFAHLQPPCILSLSPSIEQPLLPPKNFTLKDPFIPISIAEKENLPTAHFLPLMKFEIEDDDYAYEFNSNHVGDAMPMSVGEMVDVTHEVDYADVEEVLTVSGLHFGRKREMVEEKGEVWYLVSDAMVANLMGMVGSRQVVSVEGKFMQDIGVVKVFVYMDEAERFVPILFTCLKGSILKDAVKMSLDFLKNEYPNSFKPSKFIINNEINDKECFDGAKVYPTLLSLTQHLTQILITCLQRPLPNLLSPDPLLLLLISKHLLLYSPKTDPSILCSMFSDSSINPTSLKRYVLNLGNLMRELGGSGKGV